MRSQWHAHVHSYVHILLDAHIHVEFSHCNAVHTHEITTFRPSHTCAALQARADPKLDRAALGAELEVLEAQREAMDARMAQVSDRRLFWFVGVLGWGGRGSGEWVRNKSGSRE